MIYETIISINYKEGAVLCGKHFKDTEIEKARKFAGTHNTYHAAIEVYRIDEDAPGHERNRWMVGSSVFPFQRFGEWVMEYQPNNSR